MSNPDIQKPCHYQNNRAPTCRSHKRLLTINAAFQTLQSSSRPHWFGTQQHEHPHAKKRQTCNDYNCHNTQLENSQNRKMDQQTTDDEKNSKRIAKHVSLLTLLSLSSHPLLSPPCRYTIANYSTTNDDQHQKSTPNTLTTPQPQPKPRTNP